MNILIIGSGGREHAIAWKVCQSPRPHKLYIAPGNAGTAALGVNIDIQPDDVDRLLSYSLQHSIDLAIVGPEGALAAGIVDAFRKNHIRIFGSTQKAAELESSKAFSKAFMERNNIPTARYQTFDNYEEAKEYLTQVRWPVVVKASGLAAGKGVILPQSQDEALQALQSMLLERSFGSAGDKVIIEERLEGEEVSALAFTDGKTIVSMPASQDHKRLLDGDQGPNTGGMGAYAPAPIYDPTTQRQVEQSILIPTIQAMAAEGRLYQGVLYAGLILTSSGPKVLEFNCRFGDPETQVLLPLLETDLLDVIDACIDGNLHKLDVKWKKSSAVTVVLASSGYPGKYEIGREITFKQPLPSSEGIIFHAGTKMTDNKIVTAGGRVLNATSVGETLSGAVETAYRVVSQVDFPGMVFRKDIAHHALAKPEKADSSAYVASGVNIDAGNQAVLLMRNSVQSTYTPAVLAGIGSFGGLWDATAIKNLEEPVLVASTDGVGTKVRLAAQANQYESIGQDIVNHCINDILVQGAFPLFFLDYIACARLDPLIVAQIVSGISKACRESNCALLGGETAEMPGVYQPGEFDLAGTIVGVVEKKQILPKNNLAAGDVLVGLASSGPHTNGFSLIRKVFENSNLDDNLPGENQTIMDTLLSPHRSYLPVLRDCLQTTPDLVKGLAHITGGGFFENIPRILPADLTAVIQKGSWPVPPIFQMIQNTGNISRKEMYRVFNMGIGMVAVVSRTNLDLFRQQVPERTWIIGELSSGARRVELI